MCVKKQKQQETGKWFIINFYNAWPKVLQFINKVSFPPLSYVSYMTFFLVLMKISLYFEIPSFHL